MNKWQIILNAGLINGEVPSMHTNPSGAMQFETSVPLICAPTRFFDTRRPWNTFKVRAIKS